MSAQLSFALDNPGAPNTVYVSTTASDNQLTLVVSTNGSASFTPGTMVPFAQAAGGTGSLLYLDLSALGLTTAEFGALTLTATGWTSQLDTSQGQLICFTPTAPVSIGSSQTITLQLDNFTMATKPSSPSVGLDVYCYRITGVTSGNIMWLGNFSVSVQYPPNKNDKDLHLAIAVAVAPNEVVNSISGHPQAQNNLVLQFAPGSNPTPVVADGNTVFTLSFVYATDADGFGALLNPTTGVQPPMAVVAGVGASSWVITPDLSAQSPYWTLKPPGGTPIIGTGVQSVVSFNINNLVTTFQPGPTLIIVSYDKVPGYQSGSYSILIEKDPHVAITSFQVQPEKSVLSGGVAQVTLSWATSNATQLTLQPVGQDVTGTTQFVATIQDTTPFTLIAEGIRPGNVDNTAYADVTATVTPVVNSFTASPASIYQGDFAYNVGLNWNVNTTKQVQLTSSATGPDPNSYNAIGSVTKSLAVPQMLTLTAAGTPPVSRSVIVPGFALVPKTFNPNAAGAGVAAPANAAFVAMAVPGANAVSILSTATYQPITSVTVGSGPQSVAFSPDGATMFVANQGDGTVSVIGVTNTASTAPYQFSPIATVSVGGAPQQIAVGADGSAWVTVDAGTGNGTVVKITNTSGNTYTTASAPVGVNPRGVAVTPSNGLVFVANQGSNSASVIANPVGNPVAKAPITGVGAPNGLAVSPDGNTLLVACATGNAVVSINVPYYATATRKTYTLQGTPAQIAMFPGGAYAVVTCVSNSTAVLLNYQTGTTASATLPAQPAGIGVTPGNGMAVIAIPSQNSVCVVTFADYAQVGSPVGCGGAVTDAAVTPDAGTVLLWYDANITVQSGPGPIPGLSVYSVANQSASPALTKVALYDLAISPGANDDAFYVAPTATMAVSVYRTSTMKLIATIPIQPARGASKRQPMCVSVSADGATLFVLTNDGSNNYGVVVVQADLSGMSFTQLADVAAFTTAQPPLRLLFAAAPDGSAAYAVDTVGSKFYAVSQSGQTWQACASPIALISGSIPTTMALLPDGSKAYVLVTIGFNLAFCVVDPSAWTMQPVYLPDADFSMQLNSIVALPDGTKLLGADSIFSGIRILDAESLDITQTISWSSAVQLPYGIAVAPDGSRIYCANVGSADVAIAEQVQPS